MDRALLHRIPLRAIVVAMLAWVVLLAAARTKADADIRIRIAGRPSADAGTAPFTIANHTSDVLEYATYDGGNVHNGLEREENGAWVDASPGYCGLGRDGERTVAANGSGRFSAYVGATPGTYRIRVQLARRTAAGVVSEDVVSAPFQVR